jgi:2,4-dichlorophenol 6-monooxygenase
MASLFADTPVAKSRRAIFTEVMEMQRLHFRALDIELGSTYERGWFVPDGTKAPQRDPYGVEYDREVLVI